MTERPWIDAQGRGWRIVDYRRPAIDARAQRVPLTSDRADGRAFIPSGWEGATLLYEFGRVAYHDVDDRTLANQLQFAKPVGSSAAVRLGR